MNNQVFANATHKVIFSKDGNSYQVSSINNPGTVLRSIDVNEVRAYERAVAFALLAQAQATKINE
ncbi:56L [Xanthomonas phage Xp10]|uniref:56L n=1 Tax=Xanthomonas phage Xp10 TaxID=2907956 RepID=Q7Y5G0_9CAUD|nr:hypothetical protein Xp10p57 [Xanthomonas phage Xp10]AAP58724.1 56L [Xanthomonas phage Xp10]